MISVQVISSVVERSNWLQLRLHLWLGLGLVLWSGGMSCVATVKVWGRKRRRNTFTAGYCQCGGSRMRADDGKDLRLLASCDGNLWQVLLLKAV